MPTWHGKTVQEVQEPSDPWLQGPEVLGCMTGDLNPPPSEVGCSGGETNFSGGGQYGEYKRSSFRMWVHDAPATDGVDATSMSIKTSAWCERKWKVNVRLTWRVRVLPLF